MAALFRAIGPPYDDDSLEIRFTAPQGVPTPWIKPTKFQHLSVMAQTPELFEARTTKYKAQALATAEDIVTSFESSVHCLSEMLAIYADMCQLLGTEWIRPNEQQQQSSGSQDAVMGNAAM